MSENDVFEVRRANEGDMKPRFRISAKQTAKGLWQLDCTVEVYNDDAIILSNKTDGADQKRKPLGRQLLEIIKGAEQEFKADGKQLVSDPVNVSK